MIVGLAADSGIALPLRGYLRDRLAADIDYATGPHPILDGWETYIYCFQLKRHEALPTELSAPLVLRVYASKDGLPRLRHEYAVQDHLHRLGYPVPLPVLLETNADVLGGPFMLMEQIPGCTLLETLYRQPWRIFRAPKRMARLHTWLHRLPVAGFPSEPAPFLDRHLAMLEKQIDEFRLDRLQTGFAWLMNHRPPPPMTPAIVHLDFHPINLLTHRGRFRAVIDWCEADVGDPVADLAVTLMLIWCTPIEPTSLWRRMGTWPGRFMLFRRYRRAYRRLVSVDSEKLTYYLAWAALRRLGRYGMWLRAGPEITGSKPTCTRYLTRSGIARLCDFFRDHTGIEVSLDLARGEPKDDHIARPLHMVAECASIQPD